MDTTTPNEETLEPNVPAELADSPRAVECWTLNYPEVAKGGELTPAEENALVRYCLLWAEWLDTADNIKKFGKVIPKKNAAGEVTSYKDRPEVARQRQLDVSLRQLEKSLGLDSGSRRREEEEEDAADQPKSSRGRADHLKKYQFKKGQSGNPKGLPKGRVSLTTKLKKLFQLPVRDGKKRANKNYTYADRFVEVMMEAALAKDFKFAKEIFERVEGKVPDHLVMDSTKQLVAQEVAKFAHSMVQLVEDVCRSALDDKDADAVMATLQARVVAKFTEDEPAVLTEVMVAECGNCGEKVTITTIDPPIGPCSNCGAHAWKSVPAKLVAPVETVDEIPPAVPGDAADGQELG